MCVWTMGPIVNGSLHVEDVFSTPDHVVFIRCWWMREMQEYSSCCCFAGLEQEIRKFPSTPPRGDRLGERVSSTNRVGVCDRVAEDAVSVRGPCV